jgi:thiamine kinase-like enzyme
MINSIGTIYERATSNLRGIACKKRLAAEIIAKGNFPIRTGLWFVGPEFSRNYAVPKLPSPLDGVKRWGGWRKGKILKLFVRLFEVLIYPWITYASRPQNAQFVADVVLVNRLHEPIGFDLKEHKVIKSMSIRQIRLLETCVSHLDKIYLCVPFQADHESGYTFEDMISGSVFSVTSEEVRIDCVQHFFEGLRSATSLVLDSEAIDRWHTACRELLSQNSDSNLEHYKIIKYVDELIVKAKTTWVHGDLFGENIIVTSEGAVLIDYDKSGIAPTFTDIMTLFVFEARTLRFDLMDIFFQGGFDKEFISLGCQLDGEDVFLQRVSIFISWLGWKMTTEDFSLINMKRFLEVLERYFNKTISLLTRADLLIGSPE